MEPAPHVAVTQVVWRPRASRLRRVLARVDVLFLLAVALPTLAAGVYYGLIASDRFISESSFVVRNPQRAGQSTGLGALLQGSALGQSQDDAYSVHEFIQSRDALRELDERLHLRSAFGAGGIDVLNRFPGINDDASFEALHRYYQKRVIVEYDTTSSISVLRVAAYTAKDARDINELLLQMGERLVNNLNSRSREDLIAVAQKEVELAETKAESTALALSSFRSGRSVFDPDKQSALQLQAVGKLQEELMATTAQLAQLRQVSPDNPQVALLASQVQGLQRNIATESAKVTGGGGGGASLAGKSPEYDRLLLVKSVADRQLASTLTALEVARAEAQRKQLYLERLVEPNLPDVAVEPRRLRSVVMVLLVGLIVWGVLSMIVASIREHAE